MNWLRRRAELIALLEQALGRQQAAQQEASRQADLAAQFRGAIQIVDEAIAAESHGQNCGTSPVPKE